MSQTYTLVLNIWKTRALQNYEDPVLFELLWDTVDLQFDSVPSGAVLFKKNR